MLKINVGDVYDVVGEGRRVRVVDRRNGAVPVDFTAPRDAPPGVGDAIKQALAMADVEAETVEPAPVEAETVEPAPVEAETVEPAPVAVETVEPAPVEAGTVEPAPVEAEAKKTKKRTRGTSARAS